MPKFAILLLCTVPFLGTTTTYAFDEVANNVSAQTVADEIDQGLKTFGYMSGLALGCVAKGQKSELENEVLNINGDINRTLGADRAFLYAAAFGYGTNIELNQEECKELLATYEQRVATFKKGLGEGG